jgi:hypothetical protein
MAFLYNYVEIVSRPEICFSECYYSLLAGIRMALLTVALSSSKLNK